MNKRLAKLTLGVILMVLATACSTKDEQFDSSTTERSSWSDTTAVPRPANPPTSAVIGSHATALNGSDSWDEFLARQAGQEREYLIQLDRRYFGALSFSSVDERNYMMHAGFPTPEEWLAAIDLTDAQLREKADAGDAKLAGMFADRMAERFRSLHELSQAGDSSAAETDRALVATLAVSYATQAMRGDRGAFGVYVEGMVKSSILGTWEPMSAAMLEADRLGDPRVRKLILEMATRHPRQDIGTIFSSLEGMHPTRR
ncbi:MAG TPA: hypothetical protein VFS99_02900 [Xanthomonadaceae bacterium]|nr:hypothetical protein [Xanthomonadaceae bacterium]